MSTTLRVLATLAALSLASLAFIGCGDDEPSNIQQNPYPEPAPAYLLMSVWGTGPQDVFAVGQPGVILHYDGAWTLDSVPDTMLTSVWGTSSSDVYACGHNGAIWHFDGSAWRRENSGTTADLFDIGRGPYGEIHAVGREGTILRRTGGGWSQDGTRAYRYSPIGVPIDTLLFNVEGATATRITPYAIGGMFAVVLMENDHTEYDHRWLWGNFEDPQSNLITAANASAVLDDNFMANEAGKLFYLDENLDGLREWRLLRRNGIQAVPSTFPESISGLWLDVDAGVIYLTTPYGKVATITRDGAQTSTVLATGGWFTDVWGSSGTDIYVTGYNGVLYHFDGNNWTRLTVPVPEGVDKALLPADGASRSIY
ncbi:MAG: hypothetical protein C0395_04080 [Gemmatimonas sp.]|nr:hypothetical protein [Gemmatimonas sp.]